MQSLTSKLCQQHRVPALVADLIPEYLNERGLLAIGVVSRDLALNASAPVYRHVELHLAGSESSIRNPSLLFRTWLTDSTAAGAVRSVSLAGEPLLPWRARLIGRGRSEGDERAFRGETPPDVQADLTHFNRRETELYNNIAAVASAQVRPSMSGVPAWALCLCILRRTLASEDLSISSDYLRLSGFRDLLRDMAEKGAFRNLQSCNLCLDLLDQEPRHPRVADDWDGALLMPFITLGVKSIAVVASVKCEAVRRLRQGGLSITRLALHHYQIQVSDLSALLVATPRLHRLEYHATAD